MPGRFAGRSLSVLDRCSRFLVGFSLPRLTINRVKDQHLVPRDIPGSVVSCFVSYWARLYASSCI